MTRFDFTVFAPVETGIRRLECRARRNPIAAAKPQQEVPSVWKILHRKIHRAPADAEPGSGLKPRTSAFNPKRTMGVSPYRASRLMWDTRDCTGPVSILAGFVFMCRCHALQ